MKAAAAFPILLSLCAIGHSQQSSASAGATEEHKFGIVCVLPNSPDPPTRFSPGGYYNLETLTIAIDSRSPVRWPHKAPFKIEDIDLKERHLIVLRSDGKRIQSFHFRFTDYKDRTLCVSYDGYQGVQFGDRYTTYWCRCK
jgi:hypothetical protein